MRKIRLFGIVFILALSFTACNTADSLNELIDETAIETVQSTEEEDEQEAEGTGASK